VELANNEIVTIICSPLVLVTSSGAGGGKGPNHNISIPFYTIHVYSSRSYFVVKVV